MNNYTAQRPHLTRTHLGVHALPGPLWAAIRVWKADMAPPAEAITD